MTWIKAFILVIWLLSFAFSLSNSKSDQENIENHSDQENISERSYWSYDLNNFLLKQNSKQFESAANLKFKRRSFGRSSKQKSVEKGSKTDSETGRNSSPHIIVIVADDLGWNDISFHGSNQIPTPNIDALAFNGVIFDRYYVNPICTPSRSSLMTGRYPIHTGMQEYVIAAASPYGLGLDQVLLPEYLNKLGYRSHAVGKWHLGHYKRAYTPTYRGFESFYGYWLGKGDYYDHSNTERKWGWGYDFRRNMDIDRQAFGHYSTDLFTNEAVNVINRHNVSENLFLYLAHQAVHSANFYEPLQAPSNLTNQFNYIRDENRRKFAAMLTKLDESVGLVISALSKREMLQNSVIFFTTDNGGPAGGFDLNAASNWPLRGVKSLLWEGGVRGVGFMWSPLLQRYSYVSSNLMHITDVLPTLYSAAGGNVTDLGSIDGFDQWSYLIGKQSHSPRKNILHNIGAKDDYDSYYDGRYKFLSGSHHNGHWSDWYGPSGRHVKRHDIYDLMVSSHVARAIKCLNRGQISRQKWLKLRQQMQIKCDPRPMKPSSARGCQESPCVFDLENDPCEQTNIAKQVPDVLARLKNEVNRYKRSAIKPRNVNRDPKANPKYWNYNWINWKDYL